MNNMGGEDDLGDLDGADEVRIFLSFTSFQTITQSTVKSH